MTGSKALPIAASVTLALCAAWPAAASNGMNMIGYGAESISMGGADLAVTDSPSAMNINPAGLGQCTEPEVDFGVGVMDPSLRHRDRLGNSRTDVLDRYPMPFVGYAHPLDKLTLGVGLFIQGGMGAEFPNMLTPFSAMLASGQLPPALLVGNSIPLTDGTRTNVMHVKLTPSVAWRAGPRLTLGAGLNLSYSRAELELFPNTSVRADLDRSGVPGDAPGDFFFGMAGEDLSATGVGLRLGFQYRLGDLALGGVYATETDLDFDGGSMRLNLSALGLGPVPYDCSMSGFSWPRQAALGVAYRAHPRLLLAADLDWFDWSSAIQTVTIELENPGVPGAPPARQIPMRMGWRDQWVWALGLEWEARPSWSLRFGFNHGDSPIPDDMMRPLFPAIAEDHLTAGLGLERGRWILDLALEYVLEEEKVNNSFDRAVNPFGPGSTETLSQVVTHLMVRRVLTSARPTALGP